MNKRVVTFGEVMMRLSPPGYAKFSQATTVEVVFGGGEANVSISLAYFGLNARHVTCFPDNFIGKSATQYLRHHWLDTSKVAYGPGWMGKYFLEKGAVHRSSEVVYERDQSAFSKIRPEMFDWEDILEGADWFHWTGITPAISQGTADTLQDAIETSNKLGISVSADIFSRKSLWQYGKTKQEILSPLVAGCDVLIASTYDIEDVFGIGEAHVSFSESCRKLTEKYPHLKKVADKNRENLNASHNRIQGKMWSGETEKITATFDVTHIIDRVGTGDAFAAGLIYGLLYCEEDEAALKFATAACALKHTVEGDANMVSVADVQSLVNGDFSGRIKR